MRFRVRKPDAVYRAKHMWHSWFAWHPVRVPTKGRMSGMTLVWLEKIERKGEFNWDSHGGSFYYEFRYLKGNG